MTPELLHLLEFSMGAWFAGYCAGWFMNIIRVKFEQWLA